MTTSLISIGFNKKTAADTQGLLAIVSSQGNKEGSWGTVLPRIEAALSQVGPGGAAVAFYPDTGAPTDYVLYLGGLQSGLGDLATVVAVAIQQTELSVADLCQRTGAVVGGGTVSAGPELIERVRALLYGAGKLYSAKVAASNSTVFTDSWDCNVGKV